MDDNVINLRRDYVPPVGPVRYTHRWTAFTWHFISREAVGGRQKSIFFEHAYHEVFGAIRYVNRYDNNKTAQELMSEVDANLRLLDQYDVFIKNLPDRRWAMAYARAVRCMRRDTMDVHAHIVERLKHEQVKAAMPRLGQ